MVVTLDTLETKDEITLVWVSTEIGDEVTNEIGVLTEHPTHIVSGTVKLEVDGQREQEIAAPQTITLPTQTRYTFTTVTESTQINCVYSKLSGAADEVQHLRRETLDKGEPISRFPRKQDRIG